jgi:general secretion pathway protein F
VAATLGALLATRVPLASALEQAGSAAGDAAIAQRLDDARERVLTGETLSRALSLSQAVPPSAIQLIRAGEATGDVAAMLIYAAKLDRERVQTELRGFMRLVEPAMILAFGGLVALVAASLLQAVYAVRPVA